MGTTNLGRQDIVWRYEAPLRGNFFAQAMHGLIEPGFIDVPKVTFVGAEITIPIFACFLLPNNSTSPASNKLVKIVTKEPVVLTVPQGTVAIGLSYEFRTESSWYADFDFLQPTDLLSYKGLIVCEITMEGEFITDLHTLRATVPPNDKDILVPTAVVEAHVDAYRVNKVNSPAHGLTFTPPTGNYLICYLGSEGPSQGPGLFYMPYSFSRMKFEGIEILGAIEYSGESRSSVVEHYYQRSSYIPVSTEDQILLGEPVITEDRYSYTLEMVFPGHTAKIKVSDWGAADFASSSAVGVLFTHENSILEQNFSLLSAASDIRNYLGVIFSFNRVFKNRRLNWVGKVSELFEPRPLSDSRVLSNPYDMIFTRDISVKGTSFSKGDKAFTFPTSSSVTQYVVLDSRGRSLVLEARTNSGNVHFGQYSSWTEDSLPHISLISQNFFSQEVPEYTEVVGTDVPANFEVMHSGIKYTSSESIRGAPSNFRPSSWKSASHDNFTVINDITHIGLQAPLLEGKVQRFFNDSDSTYTINLSGDSVDIYPYEILEVLYHNNSFRILNEVKPSLRNGFSRELLSLRKKTSPLQMKRIS